MMLVVEKASRIVFSWQVLVLAFLVGVPLIIFRTIGFVALFFCISLWNVVPIVALSGLLTIAVNMPASRKILATGLMGAYLGSVFFEGWGLLLYHLSRSSAIYSWILLAEAALILLLFTRCAATPPKGWVAPLDMDRDEK